MVSILGEILVYLESSAMNARVPPKRDRRAELPGALGALGELHLRGREQRPPREIFFGLAVGLGGGLGERDDGVRDLERLDLPGGGHGVLSPGSEVSARRRSLDKEMLVPRTPAAEVDGRG